MIEGRGLRTEIEETPKFGSLRLAVNVAIDRGCLPTEARNFFLAQPSVRAPQDGSTRLFVRSWVFRISDMPHHGAAVGPERDEEHECH